MGRYSSKPFNSLWNKEWNEKVDMDIIEKDLLTDLSFDQETKKLNFIIKRYHKEPKITRYVTSNYVKTPVYEDYSERTRIIKKFNKTINPIRFVTEDVLKLDLHKKFIIRIIDEIGIIPEWRKKEIELEKISQNIKNLEKSFRNFEYEQKKYSFRRTDFQENPSNFWLRFFLGFLTCFLSFLGYVSKEEAFLNKEINKKNIEWNKDHKINIDQQNQKILKEIEKFNKKNQLKIDHLQEKFDEIENKEIKIENIDEDGWNDLKTASNFSYSNLNNKKGIYIIWNKTKNKYYVGQSKNIGKRLSQHVKDGEVKNILFAKDWYDNNEFVFKYYFCETKDELDFLQKRYIDEYSAFENGYNSTNGNV